MSLILKVIFSATLGVCLTATMIAEVSAAPDLNNTKLLGASAEIQAAEQSCGAIRTRYAELTCNLKATSKPLDAKELGVPEQYSMSPLWSGTLLLTAQYLYDDPRDNLRSISSKMLSSAIVDCRKVQQCENQVLRYFGIRDDSISFLYGLTSKKRHNGQRNESLAKALSKQTHDSDAGEFFNRFTDIGICKKIAVEAKEVRCELAPQKK